jgi:hypothetical protein
VLLVPWDAGPAVRRWKKKKGRPNGGRAGQLIGALLMPCPPCSQLGLVMGGCASWADRGAQGSGTPRTPSLQVQVPKCKTDGSSAR